MTRVQVIRRPIRKPAPDVDTRTPAGKRLPY